MGFVIYAARPEKREHLPHGRKIERKARAVAESKSQNELEEDEKVYRPPRMGGKEG